jgi:hypothetical protein
MPLMFNTLLREADVPLAHVRLLRHKDLRATKGRTPYGLWLANRPQFEWYQSTQTFKSRQKLKVPYWASFVGTPNDETLFVGLYRVKYRGVLETDTPQAHVDALQKAGSCDVYDLTLQQGFSEFDGKLFIEWGKGKRSWIQRADKRNKSITELRLRFKEPDFPGFLHFRKPLSGLDKLPRTWVTALESSRGVYLLTCPKTKEQYVGAAYGAQGFWHRWQEYVQTGHGGNVVLKSREPSDYQVSILEVAGTAATTDDILRMETQWKYKLQSREMGLNR